MDFACPFMGKTLLVVVDAHFKWIEASVVANTSSNVVIKKDSDFYLLRLEYQRMLYQTMVLDL